MRLSTILFRAAVAILKLVGPRVLTGAVGGAIVVASLHALHMHPFAAAHLQNTTVSCATSVTEIRPDTYGASMYIANSSATCVRLGGTGVTTSTGISIGAGCRDGIGASIAFNAATCISTGGGPIVVDVTYEVQ